MPPHFTSGDIARRLDRKPWVVRHILNSRDIPPIGKAGITRLYDESAIAAVVRELQDQEVRVKELRRRKEQAAAAGA